MIFIGKMSVCLATLQPMLLGIFVLLDSHWIHQTSSQSIIYSITRSNSNHKHLEVPTVSTPTTSSSLQENGLQNATSTKQGSSELHIHVRSKRFMSKMPRMPSNLQHPNNTEEQSANLKDSSKNISLVLADLLDDYDYNQRPGYGGPPAVITTNLEIRSMGPISELNMEYSLDCYFRQKWKDERLRFTGSADFLSLNIKMLDKIWKPDTYFHTGKGSHLHMITSANKFLRIYREGYLLYSMRLTIKSQCPMDLHSFPMDKQSCPLILGSYGYPNDQLIYSWDKNPVTFNSRDFALSQFDIVKTISRNGTYSFKRGNHSMLQVNFNLRRHVGYFLIQIYVPASLIVVLSWVSFWINREATADRVGLGVTAVLTLSTFGLDSRSDLPRVSYATALDWYTIFCFLFVVFTLLEFAGVHYFTKVGTGEVPFIEMDDKSSSEEDEEGEYERNNYDTKDIEQFQRTSRSHSDRWRSAALRLRRNRIKRQPHRSKRLPGKVKFASSGQFKNAPQFSEEYEQCYPNNSNGFSLNLNNCKLSVNENNLLPGKAVSMSNTGLGNNYHMPYCPKSVDYQEYVKWRMSNKFEGNLSIPLIDEPTAFFEDNVTKRFRQNSNFNTIYPKIDRNPLLAYTDNNILKQTSSWPTLLWSEQLEHGNASFPWSMADLTQTASDFEDVHPLENDASTDNVAGTENQQGNRLSTLWKSSIFSVALCLVQFWYCFTSNEAYKQEMKRRRPHGQGLAGVNSVSIIDKIARVLFPMIFLSVSIIYWSFYIYERSTEFEMGIKNSVNLS